MVELGSGSQREIEDIPTPDEDLKKLEQRVKSAEKTVVKGRKLEGDE